MIVPNFTPFLDQGQSTNQRTPALEPPVVGRIDRSLHRIVLSRTEFLWDVDRKTTYRANGEALSGQLWACGSSNDYESLIQFGQAVR